MKKVKNFFNKMNNPEFVKYVCKDGRIAFHCTGLDDNEVEIAEVFKSFLLDISKERKVFFYGYRLAEQDIPKVIDPAVILEKAKVLLNPLEFYFHLSEARVNVNFSSLACNTFLYYFDETVEWLDFLATSPVDRMKQLLRAGVLSARFTSNDHGSYYRFEGGETHKERCLQLFESLAKLGFDIERTSCLERL